jgi:gliding motility-associated-like protein
LLSISNMAKAQLCNGSLGDAVVNITFGKADGNNTDYTPTNAYTYTSSFCPNDGYYTITKNTSRCFNNSWLTINNDHTGNGGFMLVNASYEPGDFLVTKVTDLCPNTTYEFAAWLMNVMARTAIKPNITFSIETTTGTVLQSFSTGDIPESFSPQWKQYGFFFTTAASNAEVILRMTNKAPGGEGNDIALDDITFRPCSSVLITSTIKNENSDTVNICEGNTNSYLLQSNISNGFIDPIYIWQVSTDSGKIWKDIAGANSLTYLRNFTTPGFYWYRLSVVEKTYAVINACRIASNKIFINVHPNPIVDAGENRILVKPEMITLNALVIAELNTLLYWQPPNQLSDNKISNPIATPAVDTKYTLYATSPFGCKNEDTVLIKVVNGIFIPNVFTPNNDGINDRWSIPFLDPQLGATVFVYNRFGQIIYKAEKTFVDWDGKFKGEPQAIGTYVYLIRFNTNRKSIKGNFVLIR